LDLSFQGHLGFDMNAEKVSMILLSSIGTVSTMTFAKNVGPGSHTVKVQFKVTGGMASAGLRMLTVSIFKP
jgi:hypothetical protein